MKTSIIVGVQIFLISVFLTGCSLGPAGAIEKVLNQCARNSEKVNASNLSASEAAVFLASEMQKMNTRKCPPEFRIAFQEHINAWREASGAFANNTTLNAFLEGAAAGLFEDSSLFGVSQRNAAIAVQNINTTYHQLATIAAAYGARVPLSEVRK